jgi:uncharacterized membrane protein YcaP (DUF421 family)
VEPIARGLFVYFFLLILLRMTGKRSLGQLTTFDFVLLLIVAEATQQAMVGQDYSLTNMVLLVLTLAGIDLGLSLLKDRVPSLGRWVDGMPLVLMEDGELLHDRMHRERVDAEEILAAAREVHGIGSLDEIEHAVLEQNGQISTIPRRQA